MEYTFSSLKQQFTNHHSYRNLVSTHNTLILNTLLITIPRETFYDIIEATNIIFFQIILIYNNKRYLLTKKCGGHSWKDNDLIEHYPMFICAYLLYHNYIFSLIDLYCTPLDQTGSCSSFSMIHHRLPLTQKIFRKF